MVNGPVLSVNLNQKSNPLEFSGTLITLVCNYPSDGISNYGTLQLFIWKIMDIIAVNG